MRKLFPFILFFFFLATGVHGADSYSCENFFRQWMPAGDHPGLHNSVYGLEYTKLGSVFITLKQGLPYYSPIWHLGVFTHTYSPVTLEEGGSLQATAGSLGFLGKGEILYLAGQVVTPNEVRLKLITKNKFSVKPGDPKPTDRVSLEFVIPQGSGWCNAQKNFQAWVKGFGGVLEAERYQQVGDQPPPPGIPPPEAATKKGKKPKEPKEVVEPTLSPEPEPPVVSPTPAPAPSTPPSSKEKPLDPTSAEALYPPRETNLKSGMSRKEVDAKLGAPINVIKMGDKSVVYYEDVVVEFVKDKMTDIRLSDKPAPSVLKRYH